MAKSQKKIPTVRKLTREGKESIAAAARRRWKEWRRAKKTGNGRLAKKILGR